MRELLIGFHKRNSFFHRLDPISKVIWALCLMVLSLTASDMLQQLFLVLIMFFCVRVGARIPFSDLAIFVWMAFLSSVGFFLLQLLVIEGEIVLFYVGTLPITWEALNHAANVAVRMLVFVGIALVFVDSTDPHDLGLALTQNLKVDYVFALMLFIALRFMPIFEKELLDLRQAYQLRNISDKPRFWERISMFKQFVPPLLFRGVRRSVILALSMESRALRAYPERSYVTHIEITPRGKIFSAVVVVLTLLGIALIVLKTGSFVLFPTGV